MAPPGPRKAGSGAGFDQQGQAAANLASTAAGLALGDPASPVALGKLSKMLGRIRGARRVERVAIENEFAGRLGDLHKYYVVPDLQDKDPPDERNSPSLILSRQSAFGLFDEFLSRELRTDGGNNCLFFLGDAGMGKTSLLVMLKYRHLTSFLPTSADCVLIKLGHDTLERVDAIPDPANTILFLDSLDEDPVAHDHPGGAEGRLLDLLPRIARFHRAVISCRTQYFVETSHHLTTRDGHFVVGAYECPVKYLSLFTDQQVETYLLKRFKDGNVQRFLRAVTFRPADNPKLVEARQAAGAMDDLRMRPLLLSYIDDFVGKEGGDCVDFTNSYAVYHRLVSEWLRRDARKRGGMAPEEGWQVALSLGIHLARSKQRRISRDELHAIPELKAIERFKIEARSLLCRTDDFQYQFSHLTIQEFLLAHAALEGDRDLAGITLSKTAFRFLVDGERFRETSITDLHGALLDPTIDPVDHIRLLYGIEMVLLPAGEFEMGSPDNESGRSDDEELHRVRLTRPFWVGRFAVTQAQYQAVMGENPSWFDGDSRPVENVSWEDASEFCRRLNVAVEHLSSFQFRLPTEAEWEYACRAGTDSAFSDGCPCTKPVGKDAALDRLGWFDKNSGNETHPVGQKAPNAWGLYDMHGNVWEWCVDWGGAYPADMQDDPVGPETGASHVVRGGSCWLLARACRSACRR
jgi:formylglycine-generating enzyme required for sulfatase activity